MPALCRSRTGPYLRPHVQVQRVEPGMAREGVHHLRPHLRQRHPELGHPARRRECGDAALAHLSKYHTSCTV